jgi:hypothetical protein
MGKSFSEARQEITGDSWLDELARASLSAAGAKFDCAVTPELDDDPDEAVAVLTGNARGDRAYAALCLRIAIAAGSWPQGWRPRG